MRIQSIKLKNFRGFIDRTFFFNDRLTLIIGENGSGKSSLLEGISVALGGWLCEFDGLESSDKRNITKADRRTIVAAVNSALLPQVPVEVSCDMLFQDCEEVSWSRELNSLRGRTTTAELRNIRGMVKDYNHRIMTGKDKDIIMPLVAYYSAARLWNEPIQREPRVKRENNRLFGYKKAITFTNSIKDAFRFADRLAILAYRDDDVDSKAKIDAITHALRTSLESILPGAEVPYDLKTAEFLIKDKDGTTKPYSLLSDGYRCALSLFIDICYRILTLNPQLGDEAIKLTSGIVLLDEVDLHLHPKWQQKILGDLQNVFPKLQFIATTHAPSVIQSVKNGSLLILSDSEEYRSQKVYGRDVNSILRDVMGAKERPTDIEDKLKDIARCIDTEQWEAAGKKVTELENVIGENDPEITRSKVMIELGELED